MDDEERELRAILGDLVFGVDDETMEHAVLARLRDRGWTLGVAESVTGGLIGGRIASVPGASETFRGTIGVVRDRGEAFDPRRHRRARGERGVRASRWRKARSVCSAPTWASRSRASPGPTEQDGVAVGTVCFGIAFPDGKVEAVTARLPGDRERVRQFSTISLMNLLRQRLDALA